MRSKKIITHFFPESKPNIPVRSEARVGKAGFFEGAGREGASRPSDGAGGAARVAEKIANFAPTVSIFDTLLDKSKYLETFLWIWAQNA